MLIIVCFLYLCLCSVVGLYGLSKSKKLCLWGLNYSSRGGGDLEPDWKRCKTYEVIYKELQTLKKITRRIRIYSLIDCQQARLVLKAVNALEMQIWLGIWIDQKPIFQEEYEELEKLLQEKLIVKENLLGIHVGNEALYRRDIPVKQSIEQIVKVKNLFKKYHMMDIPVSSTEVADYYLLLPKLVRTVDIMTANIFPQWENQLIRNAPEILEYKCSRLHELGKENHLTGKKLNGSFILSETGFASGGYHWHTTPASPENQIAYFSRFWCRIDRKHHWLYFYFTGIDDLWKSYEDIEGYFGLLTVELQLKDHLKNMTIDCSRDTGDVNDVWELDMTTDCPLEKNEQGQEVEEQVEGEEEEEEEEQAIVIENSLTIDREKEHDDTK